MVLIVVAGIVTVILYPSSSIQEKMEKTVFQEKRSVCDAHLNSQGTWAFTVQSPMYENGQQTGALYGVGRSIQTAIAAGISAHVANKPINVGYYRRHLARF